MVTTTLGSLAFSSCPHCSNSRDIPQQHVFAIKTTILPCFEIQRHLVANMKTVKTMTIEKTRELVLVFVVYLHPSYPFHVHADAKPCPKSNASAMPQSGIENEYARNAP